jgi:hypothetical protein
MLFNISSNDTFLYDDFNGVNFMMFDGVSNDIQITSN